MFTPTTRTESALVTGPYTFDGTLRHADLRLRAVPGLEHATVTVTATGSRAAEAIQEVELTVDGTRASVRLPSRVRILGIGASIRVEAQVPQGSQVVVEAGSGDVLLEGELGVVKARSGSGDVSVGSATAASLAAGSGDLGLERAGETSVATGSGDITLGEVGDLRARLGSGDLTVRAARGNGSVKSGSGDVVLREVAGAMTLTTGSGRVTVGAITGRAHVRSGSGAVTIERLVSGEAEVGSGSGSLTVGVPYGTAVLADVESRSGRVHSDLAALPDPGEATSTASLRARLSSGSIAIRRAS